MTYIYSVIHFGCNSSYNDMWIPNVFVYKSYEEAYSKYTEIYNKLLYEVKYLCYESGHYLYKEEKHVLCDHDNESCDNKIIYNISDNKDDNCYINKEIHCLIQRGGDEGMKRPEGIKFVTTLLE